MADVLEFKRPVAAPVVDPQAEARGICDDALASAIGGLVRVAIVGVDLDGNEFFLSTNDYLTDLADLAAAAVTILENVDG